MGTKRKIALVVKRTNFKEAEEADDLYWSEASEQYRLETLMDLRAMVFGNAKVQSIQKVVCKKDLHEKIET